MYKICFNALFGNALFDSVSRKACHKSQRTRLYSKLAENH